MIEAEHLTKRDGDLRALDGVSLSVAPGAVCGLIGRNAGALNTHAGFLVAPLLAMAGAAFAVDSGIIGAVLDLLPLSHAARLLAGGVSPRPGLDAGPASWLVVAAWAPAAHALMACVPARREL